MWQQLLITVAVKLIEVIPAIIRACKTKGKGIIKRFK